MCINIGDKMYNVKNNVMIGSVRENEKERIGKMIKVCDMLV